MKKKRYMNKSILICPVCKKQFPIMRSLSSQRERNHVKDIWCPFCGKIRKFTEIRTGDYYCINNTVIY